MTKATMVWEVTRACGVSYWFDYADVVGIGNVTRRQGLSFTSRRIPLAEVPVGTVVSRLGAPDVRVTA